MGPNSGTGTNLTRNGVRNSPLPGSTSPGFIRDRRGPFLFRFLGSHLLSFLTSQKGLPKIHYVSTDLLPTSLKSECAKITWQTTCHDQKYAKNTLNYVPLVHKETFYSIFFITFSFFSSVDSKHVEISRGSNCVFWLVEMLEGVEGSKKIVQLGWYYWWG